jgi:hypothetical protein
VGEDRGDPSASDKTSGSQGEDDRRGFLFLSKGDMSAIQRTSGAICTFAAVVTVVYLFTKSSFATLLISGITLVVVILGIFVINRSKEAYAKASLKKYRPTAARNDDKKVVSGLL